MQKMLSEDQCALRTAEASGAAAAAQLAAVEADAAKSQTDSDRALEAAITALAKAREKADARVAAVRCGFRPISIFFTSILTPCCWADLGLFWRTGAKPRSRAATPVRRFSSGCASCSPLRMHEWRPRGAKRITTGWRQRRSRSHPGYQRYAFRTAPLRSITTTATCRCRRLSGRPLRLLATHPSGLRACCIRRSGRCGRLRVKMQRIAWLCIICMRAGRRPQSWR